MKTSVAIRKIAALADPATSKPYSRLTVSRNLIAQAESVEFLERDLNRLRAQVGNLMAASRRFERALGTLRIAHGEKLSRSVDGN